MLSAGCLCLSVQSSCWFCFKFWGSLFVGGRLCDSVGFCVCVAWRGLLAMLDVMHFGVNILFVCGIRCYFWCVSSRGGPLSSERDSW